jgi:hypothetical protein
VLGGAMTVVAGLIATRFGPVVDGLFLAFRATMRVSISFGLEEGAALYVVGRSFVLSPMTVATAANYPAKSLILLIRGPV